MVLHLIKLCVGCGSIEELLEADRRDIAAQKAAGRKPELIHRTRQLPRRAEAIVPGGSLYWVIKGAIQVRQPLLELRPVEDAEGNSACDIVFSERLIPVRPTPRRAFQGWRYLETADAPPDLFRRELAEGLVPASMRRELLELCLI